MLPSRSSPVWLRLALRCALRFALGTTAVAWVLPLWQVDLLPMLDYPQQLAMAAIVRWIGDPVRAFGQDYELALWRPRAVRGRHRRPCLDPADRPRGQARALPVGWIALLYFVVPEFTHGYLVSERLIPVAATVGVAALPRPFLLRLRVAAALTLLLVGWQLSAVRDGFRTFNVEAAGLRRVLDRTEPGQALAGLLFEQSNSTWMAPSDLLRHAPAYYQVYTKGGGSSSRSSSSSTRPCASGRERNWEDRVLSTWWEADAYKFELARDGDRFRYFLVRGGRDDVTRAFGPRLAGARVTSSVRWVDLAGNPPRQQVTALSSSPP